MELSSFLLLSITVFNVYIHQTTAISCYQCNSNEDAYCAEMFNPDQLDVEPTVCDKIYEANYCVKATGMYEGTIGTKRFCSSRHHGNYCEYIKRPGDDRFYRSCVFTCYRDGCNSGHKVASSLYYIIFLLTMIWTTHYVFH